MSMYGNVSIAIFADNQITPDMRSGLADIIAGMFPTRVDTQRQAPFISTW